MAKDPLAEYGDHDGPERPRPGHPRPGHPRPAQQGEEPKDRPKGSPEDQRQARLAAALRDNLRRRKAQERVRAAEAAGSSAAGPERDGDSPFADAKALFPGSKD